MALIEKAKTLYAAKGKKVVQLAIGGQDVDTEEILKLVLGPTGNLRAPTLRVGKRLIVGFNEEMYREVFG